MCVLVWRSLVPPQAWTAQIWRALHTAISASCRLEPGWNWQCVVSLASLESPGGVGASGQQSHLTSGIWGMQLSFPFNKRAGSSMSEWLL